jgi:hypothetical protein
MILAPREDVNGLRGGLLRQGRVLAAVEVDRDCIKTYLELTDA